MPANVMDDSFDEDLCMVASEDSDGDQKMPDVMERGKASSQEAVPGEAQVLQGMERGKVSSTGAVSGEAQVPADMERGQAPFECPVFGEAPVLQRLYDVIGHELYRYPDAKRMAIAELQEKVEPHASALVNLELCLSWGGWRQLANSLDKLERDGEFVSMENIKSHLANAAHLISIARFATIADHPCAAFSRRANT